MGRTERISDTLMACSTTPRTTERYLAEIADVRKRVQRHEVLYAEVKICMSTWDVQTALALIELLPADYRNASAYRRQCLAYDALCRKGVLQRNGLSGLRATLAGILVEADGSPDVIRYADALARNGYNEESVRTLTLYTVDVVVSAAQMSDGHTHMMMMYAEGKTPVGERCWIKMLTSLERCAPVVACLRTPSRGAKASKNADKEDDTDADGDAKGTKAASARGDDDAKKGGNNDNSAASVALALVNAFIDTDDDDKDDDDRDDKDDDETAVDDETDTNRTDATTAD